MATATSSMGTRKVVAHPEWEAARKELLKKEKEFTRFRDEVSRLRRELPWERVEKPYVFDTPSGKQTLADLFASRSQLMVYHFMLGPDWEQGCPSCSFLADHFDGALVHLAARDVRLVVVSRAPLAQIEAFKKRMGWGFPWVSSFESDFNHDFQVSFTKEEAAKGEMLYNYQLQKFPSEEAPGASAFCKDAAGNIFHTYSTYARGLDILLGAYNWLDMAPKGRDEEGLSFSMAWVRHHDRYDDAVRVDAKAAQSQAVKALELMRQEIREEAAITKRVLDRVPGDKLTWKPHSKSMSLGQLALHIANIPGNLARIAKQDEFDVAQGNFNPPGAQSLQEIQTAFENSLRASEEFLDGLSEQSAQGQFRLLAKGTQVFSKPRVNVLRTIMMNHLYHHRGQLSVYLRLLEVPVPVIYGRSADESPFI